MPAPIFSKVETLRIAKAESNAKLLQRLLRLQATSGHRPAEDRALAAEVRKSKSTVIQDMQWIRELTRRRHSDIDSALSDHLLRSGKPGAIGAAKKLKAANGIAWQGHELSRKLERDLAQTALPRDWDHDLRCNLIFLAMLWLLPLCMEGDAEACNELADLAIEWTKDCLEPVIGPPDWTI